MKREFQKTFIIGMESANSLLNHIYSHMPRGEEVDRMRWHLNGSGKFRCSFLL